MKKAVGCLVVFLLFTAVLRADWPSDPELNMPIAPYPEEQRNAHVVPASDGGCFVAWEHIERAARSIYLQRILPDGTFAWNDAGIQVNTDPSDTMIEASLVAVDASDQVYVVFTSRRDGLNGDVYLVKITSDGEEDWLAPVCVLAGEDDEEPAGLLVDDAGNIVVACLRYGMDSTTAHLQKVDPDGVLLWSDSAPVIAPEYGVWEGQLLPGLAGSVAFLYTVPAGSMFNSGLNIYAQLFDSDGAPMWGENGVEVYNLGGLPRWHAPVAIGDGIGGIYLAWQDSGNGPHRVLTQHILTGGSLAWDPAGLLVSQVQEDHHQTSPALASLDDGNSLGVSFIHLDNFQSPISLDTQVLDGDGTRLLGEEGQVLLQYPMDVTAAELKATGFENSTTLLYLESLPQEYDNKVLKAIRVDSSGQSLWEEPVTILACCAGNKSSLRTAVTTQGVSVSVWCDARQDISDIYLQNVNPDGSLGNLPVSGVSNAAPVQPDEFILEPAWPNPFNASTLIRYSMNAPGDVDLAVFDLLGRRVATLATGRTAAGQHTCQWQAGLYPSGHYFVRLHGNGADQVQKVTLVK